MTGAKKVLVCDDELSILEAVSFIVRQEGYQVTTAEDGHQALRLIRMEAPDLVLLDIMMPGKSGFELCREIKADSTTRNTYVILLTAMGQDRDVEDGYQSGADEYITKPVSPRALRRRLHEILDSEDERIGTQDG